MSDVPQSSPPRIAKLAATTTTTTSVSAAATQHRPLVMLPEEHPFFSVIGRIAAEWAQFEHTLDMTIWLLVNKRDNRLMSCLTAQIQGAQSKCQVIEALLNVKELSPALREATKKLLHKLHVPQSARNRIVHDPWLTEIDASSGSAKEGKIARYKKMAKDERRFGPEPVSQAEIEKTIEDIKEIRTRAEKLRADVEAALPP